MMSADPRYKRTYCGVKIKEKVAVIAVAGILHIYREACILIFRGDEYMSALVIM